MAPVAAGALAMVVVGCGGTAPASAQGPVSLGSAAEEPSPIASEAASPFPSGPVLLDVNGTGPLTSREFHASGTSVGVIWTYDCVAASGGSGTFAVYFYGAEGSPALSDELTNGYGPQGADSTTEALNGNTGPFHVEINTECSWTLKVIGAP